MKTLSVSRLALALISGAALSACSSTPPESQPSTQQAPGTQARPVLSAGEAQNYTRERYFSDRDPQQPAWQPAPVTVAQTADFVVGPAGEAGVTHTTLQAAVDAAIEKRTSRRQYIAIMPGNYEGTLYIPAASGSVTLYGLGDNPEAVKIVSAINGHSALSDWRHTVNPSGKYMPGKPAWYMYDSCQRQHSATAGLMCSAVVWSQNNGLQLKNLTIANTLGDASGEGDNPGVALRTDGDKTQLDRVNILGRQNTLLFTNSDVHNQMRNDGQPRTLVTDSYIEGDVDMVAGRGAAVFDNTEFRLVNSRTQKEGYVFAPATLPGIYYGFLAINSRFVASGEGVAQLGRAWDLGAGASGYQPGQTANGQVAIRDSVINAGFNREKPWGDASVSLRPFSGNVAEQRNLNDPQYNRMWEYQNHGAGSQE
ncbi:putative acyl-CoA thioester hydrolase [Shimwellia blattae]|uniref:Putative lipoprotein YbhC n=1 Tax=Shimwellia blattae (strain ATCC 29907 / DSM 4481 / JCM 1650 / NBRC 105725 / CDC 9005-74) TaxID=630626 RepID=I2BB06_SHIBC|nr:putative acyl-CoA thioester hydrolase [Shimwellia blattae]AFJ47710.1 putative lipoprotein YbhC precursor [Shimwellia blattae DSM 4481 = NBRC 105725]GAB79711.1 putative acyl-CoA thioester hydrolase YbhC [Shimwellia blattae DSM 4481 = NBRC 105725]VDY65208.1 Putative acyl-CoA thioester hydrolase ybhC precursor [Shimwellia blattae]VEC23902.1 Putative acyl-CoA thioester hydrolase ybhC precursor [Shimwellia blattae]